MREERSASQILFGFLPDQTVDLKGRIWKVKEWENPKRRDIELSIVRRELARLAAPWAAKSNDGGFVDDLHTGREVVVYSLNRHDGVRVTPFPDIWMCRVCRRILALGATKCRCGSDKLSQLHFVGYHDMCGALVPPHIPRCPVHGDVRVEFPGTASAAEIKFTCPACGTLLRQGFGFQHCSCGGGLRFNVHRAASVYTPRTLVVVNPPSSEKSRRLLELGGPPRALAWVLDDLRLPSPEEIRMGPDEFRRLLTQQFSETLAESMVRQAIAAGEIRTEEPLKLPEDLQQAAEEQAVTIAMALMNSRERVSDLLKRTPPTSPRRALYEKAYPKALQQAGLQEIELVDKFPVLTGSFGYTRGSSSPGSSRLIPFEDRSGRYSVYAEIVETEALFVRLEPRRLAGLLNQRGYDLPTDLEQSEIRKALLREAHVPGLADLPGQPTIGSELLTLIHSYAHRFIRLIAVHAGIDRNALSELLVPSHGGFFVYAATKGDFVLGGLQAVFETTLDRFLRELVSLDDRCPLDPGCAGSGGACMACMHLGEPSCRYFNRYLDRSTLYGPKGYMGQVLLT